MSITAATEPGSSRLVSARSVMPKLLRHVATERNTACSNSTATLRSMGPDERTRRQQGLRLRAAREAAGYRSMNAAAEDNGWPSSTYRAHEKGTRTIGQDDADRYAMRFKLRGVKISGKAILYGEDENTPDAVTPDIIIQVPLVSWVSASMLAEGEAVSSSFDGRNIPVADLPKGDWIALRVSGDSMDRIAMDGSTIFINRRDRHLVKHGLYVFSVRGEATFKRYIDQPVARLEPYSTNPLHEPIYPSDGISVIGRVRRIVLDLF